MQQIFSNEFENYRKLGELCNFQFGKLNANAMVENGKYRFYTCSSQYVYCNTKRYEGECIILPGNGINVGESYYYNGALKYTGGWKKGNYKGKGTHYFEDGEIEFRLKSKKEKLEIKRDQEFYTLDFHPKRKKSKI